MPDLANWMLTRSRNGDSVDDQRAWVVLVTDLVGLAAALALLVFQRWFRGVSYQPITLLSVGLILAAAIASLLLLRFAGYRAAAHTTVAVGMISVWLLNIQSATDTIVKSDMVYLIVMSVLPALLLGRTWTVLYGIGTLMVVAYVGTVLMRIPGIDRSAPVDYLADMGTAVIFVISLSYAMSAIYTRALERVHGLLDQQKEQNADLRRMADLVTKNEAQARQFYRDTIYSITDGKLSIVDPDEVRPIIESAEVEIDVPDAAAVSHARQEIAVYLAQHGLVRERLDAFIVAVGEAATNAVKHADGGRVYAGSEGDSLWVAVADHGHGIESLTLPKAVLLRGFSTKPSLGLGYSVILKVSDRVLLKTDETGTTIVLFEGIVPASPEDLYSNIPDTWT